MKWVVTALATSSISVLVVAGCSSSSNDGAASSDAGALSNDSGNDTPSEAGSGIDDASVGSDASRDADSDGDAKAPTKVIYGSTKWGPDPADASDQSFAQADTQFGGTTAMPVVRYYGTADGPATVDDATVFATGRKVVIHSWKADPASVAAGNYDTELVTLLRSYPAGVTVLVSYYHEPENFTSATDQANYRAAWDHIIPLIRTTSGVTAKVESILILTGFTMSGGHPVANWWPTHQTPDYLGVDMDGNSDDSYASPLSVYDTASTNSKAYAAAQGCKWGVAEFAHERISTDTTGTGRVSFFNTMTAKFTADGAGFISYYNSRLMSGGGTIEVSTPEMTTWQGDVQGSE